MCLFLFNRTCPVFFERFEKNSTMSIWQGGNIQNSYLYRKVAKIVSKSFRKTREGFGRTKKHNLFVFKVRYDHLN